MARKRNPDKDYFSHQQEEAIRAFIKSDCSIERNDIYNRHLRGPMNKMVESIINTYKLYRKSYSFEEIHADALSFMIMKSDMFDGDLNKKAYSYFGTICKNYMITLIEKDSKKLKRNLSYEDVYLNIEENEEYSYTITDDSINYKVLFDEIVKNVKTIIKNKKKVLEEGRLKNLKKVENDIKIGHALIAILKDNREFYLEELGKNKKYNKYLISENLKNYTRLSTKEIRDSLKVYKLDFLVTKNDLIENEEI